ncbi:hypothetical protein OLEAN_C04630 [Oleispira antarctica RB-8]|uniref:Uncharacterized protein n=1 Tax=Oleispira antarctica RB-8 TaxID=698738 RepID=R4YRA8_OLEAN|nr:hypothetical protein OLEAN_C04630 [Oleispira antarctica RB-8]
MWWDKYVRAANVLDEILVEMDPVTEFSDAQKIISPYKERADLNFDFYRASNFLFLIFLISVFILGVTLLSLTLIFLVDGLALVFCIPTAISFILVFYCCSVISKKAKAFRSMEKKIYSLAFKSQMKGKKVANLKEYIAEYVIWPSHKVKLSDFLVRTSYEGAYTQFNYDYIHTLISYNLQGNNGMYLGYRAIDFLALDFHFDAEVYVAKGRGWDRSFYKRPLGIDRYKTTSNTLNKSHTILATMEDGARFFTPAVTILFEDNFEFLGIESVEVVKGGIIFVIEESPMKNLLTKHSLNLSGIEDNVETTEIKNNDKIIKFSDDLCRLLDVNLRT